MRRFAILSPSSRNGTETGASWRQMLLSGRSFAFVALAVSAVACADLLGADFDSRETHGEVTGETSDSSSNIDSTGCERDAGCSGDAASAPAPCRAGRIDCNGNPADGCEVNPATNPQHCGGCGVRCSATEVCAPNGCTSECPASLKRCGQSCVDTSSDELHCGGCGKTCPSVTNGVLTCNESECGTECDPGFSECATGCCEIQTSPPVARGVAGGYWFSCAVNAAKNVKCWGPLLVNAPIVPPTPITNFTNIIAVTAGVSHVCARTSTGAVLCAGENPFGQLGFEVNGASPAQSIEGGVVSGFAAGALAVEAGHSHTCAIDANGALHCWGTNIQGELGDSTTIDRKSPVLVTDMAAGVSAVSCGVDHTCAIRNGALYCFGRNNAGQLGDGTKANRTAPTLVSGMSTGVVAVSAGAKHTCAIKSGGSIYCWGDNSVGQLGSALTSTQLVPVAAQGLASGATEISAFADHTCAIVGGVVKCWGKNDRGQLGIPTTTAFRNAPGNVPGLASNILAISVGAEQTCAEAVNGAVYCWGSNEHGEVGGPVCDAGACVQVTPIAVPGL